jgi:hypothetical protein
MDTELSKDTTSSRGVVKYAIRNRRSRTLLSAHLKQAVLLAFEGIPRDSYRLRDELTYLNEALGLLSKEHDGTLILREERIQKSLYEFFELMEEIRFYSTQPQYAHKDRKLGKALQKFITKLNNQTSLRLTQEETSVLKQINVSAETKLFYINLRRVSSEFHDIFKGRLFKNSETKKDATVQQLREALLAQFSPELLSAYRGAESLLEEAEGLATTPEDEYFIEQVSKDYYPHIFEALQSFTNDSADFRQKETVVSESLKQFKIIQLGLQNVIDSTIANKLHTMKSQTDFLRTKILGSQAFSLTMNEIELAVDASVEEAQRLREELYLKHVAPQLEQNRQEYEAKLTALQQAHEAEFASLAELNWQEWKKQDNLQQMGVSDWALGKLRTSEASFSPAMIGKTKQSS